MKIEIRRIRPHEGPVLMQVRLFSLLDAPYAFAGTYFDSVQQPADHWADRAAAGSVGGSVAIYLAHAPDGPVGIAGAYEPDDYTETRRIYGVWVERALRKQGLGERLVDTLLEWADGSGAARCDLWVTETNTPAVALYERLGFEDTGLRQPLPSNPTILEKKLVRPAGREPSA
ncbi:MAG: GNAT family N-acetyltransferase [Acidimicrobiia bacterium]